jgi:hypothetical protein
VTVHRTGWENETRDARDRKMIAQQCAPFGAARRMVYAPCSSRGRTLAELAVLVASAAFSEKMVDQRSVVWSDGQKRMP